MANQLQNSSLISNEFMVRLKNSLAFTMSVNREWSKQFRGEGTKLGKSGVTINIRKPARGTGRRGQRAVPEGMQDQTVPLTINTQYGQDWAISSQESALNLTSYAEQIIQPAVDIISNMIDADGLGLYYEIPDFVGTPGTNPTANLTYISAGTKLSDNAVPEGKSRYVVINPTFQGLLLNTQATQFNAQADISEQNRAGHIARTFGLNVGMSQNVASHTVGALGTTPLVNVAGGVADGATSVVVDGASNSITGYWKKGDIIQFASCNGVNPSSKVSWGTPKRFAVAADADTNGSGQTTVYLTEAIRLTGPYQNVSALPADNAAILTFGHASTYAGLSGPQAIAYHKDFITFASVDLEIPPNQVMGSRASSDIVGLSVRHMRYWKGDDDQLVDRFDLLGGWKVLRPEMAVRIVG